MWGGRRSIRILRRRWAWRGIWQGTRGTWSGRASAWPTRRNRATLSFRLTSSRGPLLPVFGTVANTAVGVGRLADVVYGVSPVAPLHAAADYVPGASSNTAVYGNSVGPNAARGK